MTSQPVTNVEDCKGCSGSPSHAPEPLSENIGRSVRGSGQGWIVFTGGPPEAHLGALRHIVPKDFDRVVIHPDGVIEYTKKGLDDWEPPSPIDGYDCDVVNPGLFRPLWKSCQCRSFSVIVKRCQCLDVIAKCDNPLAANVNEFVQCETCDQCEQREEIPTPLRPQKKTL